MRQEMLGTMIYPAVLVASGIAAVGIIFIWVVPRFGGLLTQNGNAMPALSRVTISSGVWLSEHVWLALLALAALGVGARALGTAAGFVGRLYERAVRPPLVGCGPVDDDRG